MTDVLLIVLIVLLTANMLKKPVVEIKVEGLRELTNAIDKLAKELCDFERNRQYWLGIGGRK